MPDTPREPPVIDCLTAVRQLWDYLDDELTDEREVSWLELGPGLSKARQTRDLHRGLKTEESRRIDQPMLNVMENLRRHFELMKAVRFAHAGD